MKPMAISNRRMALQSLRRDGKLCWQDLFVLASPLLVHGLSEPSAGCAASASAPTHLPPQSSSSAARVPQMHPWRPVRSSCHPYEESCPRHFVISKRVTSLQWTWHRLPSVPA